MPSFRSKIFLYCFIGLSIAANITLVLFEGPRLSLTVCLFAIELLGLGTLLYAMERQRQAGQEAMRQAELLLNRLSAEQEINGFLSQSINKTSHELRGSLLVIQTSSELLEHYGHRLAEDKKKEYLRRIQSSVKNINDTIEDVLLLGKLEAEHLQICPRSVDLAFLCQEIAAEIQLGYQDRSVHISQKGRRAPVMLDNRLVRPVLTNLLNNALKYSKSGSTVELEIEYTAQNLSLKIQDNGIGIPEKDQAHLFEQFYRAANVGAVQGSGLGLTIVKKNVELHGGTINFNSQEGRGSTFLVTLPLTYAPTVPLEAGYQLLTNLPPVA